MTAKQIKEKILAIKEKDCSNVFYVNFIEFQKSNCSLYMHNDYLQIFVDGAEQARIHIDFVKDLF